MHRDKETMTDKCMNGRGRSSIGGYGLDDLSEAAIVVVNIDTVFGEVVDCDLTICFFGLLGWWGIVGVSCACCVVAGGACLGEDDAQC